MRRIAKLSADWATGIACYVSVYLKKFRVRNSEPELARRECFKLEVLTKVLVGLFRGSAEEDLHEFN